MSEIELKIHSRDIASLIEKIREYSPAADVSDIVRAYELAERSHAGQLRLSGEPYIIHPLETAIILTTLNMDTRTICAALLHDVASKTPTTLEDIENIIGADTANLVSGVTKISAMKNQSKAQAQAEALRKMLIATVKDLRVIIIKLADKLHNMRTIMFHTPEDQKLIAGETLEIYAPIARRLGMSKISSELEDLSFHVLYADEYNSIKQKLAQGDEARQAYIENVRGILADKLAKVGISPEITGRTKNYFSIFRKMKMQNKTFDEIYDIRGIRVITEEVQDCYAALGVVHSLWSPVAGRFKDYIAVPKSNMYQSLHTTVIGPEGHPLEVQIRTRDMHETAQVGIAAHWLYKENKADKTENYKDIAILNDINKLFNESGSSLQFLKDLKMNLYEDEIFVFTPKGKIVKLAQEASPIDFAFAIHSDVGMKASGAKINGKIVPLRTKLKSGDIVEILTSKTAHPSETWLKFVKSSGARYKIRAWLRKTKEEAETEESKPKKEIQKAEVLVPVDEQVKLSKLSENKKDTVSVDGTSNVLIKLARCCQPIPGEDVVGFITRGRGVTVHKRACPSLKNMASEQERFVNIVWESSPKNFYPVRLNIEAKDRRNLLKDVADEIALGRANVIKVDTILGDGDRTTLKFILEVSGKQHLEEIILRLKKLKNITDVYKPAGKVVLNK